MFFKDRYNIKYTRKMYKFYNLQDLLHVLILRSELVVLKRRPFCHLYVDEQNTSLFRIGPNESRNCCCVIAYDR